MASQDWAESSHAERVVEWLPWRERTFLDMLRGEGEVKESFTVARLTLSVGETVRPARTEVFRDAVLAVVGDETGTAWVLLRVKFSSVEVLGSVGVGTREVSEVVSGDGGKERGSLIAGRSMPRRDSTSADVKAALLCLVNEVPGPRRKIEKAVRKTPAANNMVIPVTRQRLKTRQT